MRRAFVLLLGVALVLGWGPSAGPAAAATPIECIYMVKHVHKNGSDYPRFDYEFMFWRKKGNKVTGEVGAYPGEYSDQKLTIKGARATGTQMWWGPPAERVSYRLVGKGKTLRVKGWKRVSRAYIKAISDGDGSGMRGKC